MTTTTNPIPFERRRPLRADTILQQITPADAAHVVELCESDWADRLHRAIYFVMLRYTTLALEAGKAVLRIEGRGEPRCP